MTPEHTAGHAQFLVGTFVLTIVGTFVLTKGHASTAVVPAGLFGEGEHFGQPTAVTCNYKKLAALSMLHKTKKAYYACDMIRFLVP